MFQILPTYEDKDFFSLARTPDTLNMLHDGEIFLKLCYHIIVQPTGPESLPHESRGEKSQIERSESGNRFIAPTFSTTVVFHLFFSSKLRFTKSRQHRTNTEKRDCWPSSTRYLSYPLAKLKIKQAPWQATLNHISKLSPALVLILGPEPAAVEKLLIETNDDEFICWLLSTLSVLAEVIRVRQRTGAQGAPNEQSLCFYLRFSFSRSRLPFHTHDVNAAITHTHSLVSPSNPYLTKS